MFPSTGRQIKLAAQLLVVLAAAIASFAAVYLYLGQFPEQSLKSSDTSPLSYITCLYFSVITISTVGYGDIVPVGFSRCIASIEAVFGISFVGYAISQVVSMKQEALVEYLATDRIIQTYDQCLQSIADAKELIGDRRRLFQAEVPMDPMDFICNRSNPFYAALRAMQTLNGYTAHIEQIGRADSLSVRVERAAHHVEEMAGFVRKYINRLIAGQVNWRTRRTRQILGQLCDSIDAFAGSYIVHTRYATEPYKGGGLYADIVRNLTQQIRTKL